MATEKDEIEADGVLDDNPAISNQDVSKLMAIRQTNFRPF